MTQEVEEQTVKSKLDFQQYAIAMEHILVIANRLSCKNKLKDPCCKECPLMGEIEKLQVMARDENLSLIEKQLGYVLP